MTMKLIISLLAVSMLFAGCASGTEKQTTTTVETVQTYPLGCTSNEGYSTQTGMACSGMDLVTTTVTTVSDWYCNPPGSNWINEIRANGYSCTVMPLAADEYGPSFYMKEGDRVLVWAVNGNGEPVPFWSCDKYDRYNDDVPSSCQLIRDAQMDLFAGLEPHQWNGYETGHMMMFRAFEDDTHFITSTNLCDEPYGCKG